MFSTGPRCGWSSFFIYSLNWWRIRQSSCWGFGSKLQYYFFLNPNFCHQWCILLFFEYFFEISLPITLRTRSGGRSFVGWSSWPLCRLVIVWWVIIFNGTSGGLTSRSRWRTNSFLIVENGHNSGESFAHICKIRVCTVFCRLCRCFWIISCSNQLPFDQVSWH